MKSKTVNGKVLGCIDIQRNLRVQVHNLQQVATQVNRVVKNVSGMLALSGWSVEYTIWEDMLQ